MSETANNTKSAKQLSLLSEKLPSHRLPTNSTSHKHRVQRWANFIAGFSIEFVEQCIAEVKPSQIVLDPFMGCGTTMVAARAMGHGSVGFEAHPLFYNLALAKGAKWTISDLREVVKVFKTASESRELSSDAQRFLDKLFEAENLKRLLAASAQLAQLDDRLKPLGIALFLRVAEYCCTAKTDGIYKAPDSKKATKPFAQALDTAFTLFESDICTDWYESWSNGGDLDLFHSSSTSMSQVSSNSVAAAVTSPPYLNNFDYAEMTRMQLYLLGWASSWKEITSLVRGDLITNTTTALQGKKTLDYQDACKNSLSPELVRNLAPIVEELVLQRKQRAGKKDYDYLVYPYYSQIQSVLSECHRVLIDGGKLHWVVSDAALYGVYLETQEHTARLMRELGFRNVEIRFLRRRGHRWVLKKRDGAPGKLGEYHIVAVK